MSRWELPLAECATFTSKINKGYARAGTVWIGRQVAGKVAGSLKTMYISLKRL